MALLVLADHWLRQVAAGTPGVRRQANPRRP